MNDLQETAPSEKLDKLQGSGRRCAGCRSDLGTTSGGYKQGDKFVCNNCAKSGGLVKENKDMEK